MNNFKTIHIIKILFEKIILVYINAIFFIVIKRYVYRDESIVLKNIHELFLKLVFKFQIWNKFQLQKTNRISLETINKIYT